MELVVTGAAGFIGSNFIRYMNDTTDFNIIAVDDLTDGTKLLNFRNLQIYDYQDKNNFSAHLSRTNGWRSLKAVVHFGAISSTTEWNGRLLMEENYEYSKKFTQILYRKQNTVHLRVISISLRLRQARIF